MQRITPWQRQIHLRTMITARPFQPFIIKMQQAANGSLCVTLENAASGDDRGRSLTIYDNRLHLVEMLLVEVMEPATSSSRARDWTATAPEMSRGCGPRERQLRLRVTAMLSQDRLTLAIDIHLRRATQLLRWVADAIGKGFIPATRAHQYANMGDAAFDWIDEHYMNLPVAVRPDRRHIREFANFFGTYVTSSFDVIERPGMRRVSWCGCFCPFCSHIVSAPHLQPKKLAKRDKNRAIDLMADRLTALAREDGIVTQVEHVTTIVRNQETQRHAAYSAYGYWLIRRLEGDSDGKAILGLWREIAWNRSGSPINGFKLRYQDFIDAETALVDALQTALRHG